MNLHKKTLLIFSSFFYLLVFHSPLFAHGISDTDKQSMIDGGYLQYIKLGADHMLTGYDHLLFLFGVIFFLTKFKDIAKFVTAFTVGHSITLIFATFLEISANYFLIDAVIGLTVFYKGFDNLHGFRKFFKIKPPNLLVLVFIFGLIHGFGLSTRLQQLPLGRDGLLLRILSFNLGVELGQVAALSAMLVLLNLWRKNASFMKFSTISNFGLIVAGLFLFLFQMQEFFAADLSKPEPVFTPAIAVMGDAKEIERKDSVNITIPAKKSLEYKFHIDSGSIFEYSWKTTGGELFFDLHGEADGGGKGSFNSFKKGTDTQSNGSLMPPFTGSFGWYWKNKTEGDVVVELRTGGSYTIKGTH